MSNKDIELQFTELTTDDITTYEDDYIELLVGNRTDIPNKCFSVYCDHALNELQRAKQLFCKTFQ